MKTIIAGSRNIIAYAVVARALVACPWVNEITEVVSGTARGTDRLGERWAYAHDLPIARFPADWSRYRQSAGPIRNNEMAEYADGLVAIWDGESRGTAHMIESATKKGLRVFVYRYDQEPSHE